MLFDIPSQMLKCNRCDRTMSIAEADEKEARQAGSSFDMELLTCPTCGAGIHALNTAAAAFCSYCGSSVMLEKQEAQYDPPEKVIPFQITREQCFEKFRNMLKGSFCADHRLKKNISADSFRGIYVPYHTYEGSVEGSAAVEGSETKGDTTYYYKTRVHLNHHYTGIMHDASREMPDNISESIQISKDARDLIRPFSPAYLSGFYADVSDTDPDYYIPYARSETIRKGLEDTLPTLKDDELSYSTSSAEKALLPKANATYTGDTLLPVWFMSMKSGKRVLYAVQNAVTGEMWADVPMDISRFALVALVIAAGLFVAFNSFLTLRPEMVLIAAMLLALGAQWIVNRRRRNIADKEQAEEAKDGGDDLKQRLKQRKRMASHAKGGSANALESIGGFGGLILLVILMTQFSKINDARVFKYGALALTALMGALIGFGAGTKTRTPLGSIAALIIMALGAVNLILDPFHSDDLINYALALLCMAAVVWVCIEMLVLHNRECSNPMPQFESHTGGEDHA
jgi:DNA-directed RNA polymerase subunit RPC12/RpoP